MRKKFGTQKPTAERSRTPVLHADRSEWLLLAPAQMESTSTSSPLNPSALFIVGNRTRTFLNRWN